MRFKVFDVAGLLYGAPFFGPKTVWERMGCLILDNERGG